MSELTILPSGGGVFEVIVDGDLVFSKKKKRRHAEPDEVLAEIRRRRAAGA
jgi:selenoprotein W-related protein